MRSASPLANQDGSRLRHSGLRSFPRSIRFLFNRASEQPTGRRLETAISPFLETVGDGARQQGPADLVGRRLAANGGPAILEFVNIELRQARDFGDQRLMVYG